MANYRLSRAESLDDGVRRIARRQLDEAIDRLSAMTEQDAVEAVHDARKRGKKVRGLTRLVRPALGDHYSAVNEAVRDGGRELSSARDAAALLATFDAMVAARPDVPRRSLRGVRHGLAQRAASAASELSPSDQRVRGAIDQFCAARADIEDWPTIGDVAAVRAGTRRTYRDGRRALRRCREGGTDDDLHEWRKRAKDLWYQARLLRDTAPSVMRPLASRLHDLADGLGDAHDLSVLVGRMQDASDDHGGDGEVAVAVDLARSRQADLRRRCLILGARLYAEKPKRFSARIHAYWDAWMEEGDEVDVGEIAAIAPSQDDLAGPRRARSAVAKVAAAVRTVGKSS